MKIVDAGMFQKSTDNTGHADIVAQARNTRSQAADTPNQQFNLDAGLGSPVAHPAGE